jgi:hypothetical protein
MRRNLFQVPVLIQILLLAHPAASSEPKDFLNEVTSLRDQTLQQLDPSRCVENLKALNAKLDQIAFPEYDQKALIARTDEIINSLWSLQSGLRAPLEKYPSECIPLLRDSFYSIRSLIDYVGTLGYVTAQGKKHLRGEDIDWQKRPMPLLKEEFYHGYLKGPAATDTLKFQPGDLMLTRGYTSAPSALITQTVAQRTHYSHVVFVHSTPEGHAITLEAYAGVGLDKYEIDYALKNENPRIMLIRPKDRELGKRAGNFMYDVVNRTIKDGKKIPFDYYTDTLHHERVWCGEVAYWAYDEASNHAVLLPQYKNSIDWKNLGFLEAFKIKNGEAYEAADLEVDSRFDVVLEHRDWELIQDNRYKDAILREVLRWQDDYGYRFHGQLRVAVIDTVALLRKTPLWPLLKKMGFPDLPEDASNDVLISFDRLKRLSEILYAKLSEADKAHTSMTGWPMTNAELTATVNAIRESDLAKAKEEGTPVSSFHKLYRPKIK